MDLLNHGMQYSMERPLKTYWTNLLVEAERAIKLPTQNYKTHTELWLPRK